MADIDYVASSPRGKSVEDMTRKEVIKALRNKVPVEYVRDQFLTGEEAESGGMLPVRTEKPPVIVPVAEPAGIPDGSQDRTMKSGTSEKHGVSKDTYRSSPGCSGTS